MSPKNRTPVTSSWSVTLPEGYAPIGISRGRPRGLKGYRMYAPLAPGAWFRSEPSERFCELYLAQLAQLNADKVIGDLYRLADQRIPALLCFEAPPPNPRWCHRGLVAGWLADALGLAIVELGHESLGSGWSHPKLPPHVNGVQLCPR